jgi:hypothetical protein
MYSPKEYCEFARECMRWAEGTTDEACRLILVDLSKQWMQAALEMESSIPLIDDNVPKPPGRE